MFQDNKKMSVYYKINIKSFKNDRQKKPKTTVRKLQ